MEFPTERQLLSLSACGLVGIAFMFFMHGIVLDDWWLNSREGVVGFAWTVPILTAVITLFSRSYLGGVALWMGLVTGMGIVLLLNGLGNIWPIVLAVGGAFLGVYVAIGVVPIMVPWLLWKRVRARNAR